MSESDLNSDLNSNLNSDLDSGSDLDLSIVAHLASLSD